MSGHRSNLLTQDDVDKADMIIPVKRDLGAYISRTFSGSLAKLIYLKKDIQDPWHQPIEVYRGCAHDINNMLDDIVATLM